MGAVTRMWDICGCRPALGMGGIAPKSARKAWLGPVLSILGADPLRGSWHRPRCELGRLSYVVEELAGHVPLTGVAEERDDCLAVVLGAGGDHAGGGDVGTR